MTLVAPGVRTEAVPGWRTGVSASFSLALGRPMLWLFGAIGFGARGGFLALALPIITIPSASLMSVIFSGEISTSGTTSQAIGLAVVAVVISATIAIVMLLIAAYADVAAFEILAADPETTSVSGGFMARPVTRRERLDLVAGLAVVQALALIPAIIAGLVLAEQVHSVILEWSATQIGSLYDQILAESGGQILALAAMLIVADLIYATASRAVMVARLGLETEAGSGRHRRAVAIHGALRLVRRPFRSLSIALLGWIVTVVVLAPVVWASSVAWSGLRTSLLTTGVPTAPITNGGVVDAQGLLATVVAIVIFAAIWVAATILAGFASAVRAALWSVDALR